MTQRPPVGPRRRGLGRGLEALLGPVPDPLAPAQEAAALRETNPDAAALLEVDPSLVDANPEQPRHQFDDTALAALADSIRTHGLLHPIVVERDGPRYRLVAGERRLRAVRLAGLATVAAIVRPAAESARHSLETALTENLLRADLSPIEEAAAYARLADTFGLSHEAIAMRLGRSRSAVSNTIRLLSLPAPVQRAVVDGEISAGHARALLTLPSAADQEAMALRAANEGWSVRHIEESAQAALGRPKPTPKPAPTAPARLTPDDEAVRRGLEEAISLPVELTRRPHGGRVVITFFNDDDLDTLYQRLGGTAL